MKTYAFDTEDDGAGRFVQGGVYDGADAVFFTDREAMARHIAATPGRFVTFNLEYDLVSLYWPDVEPVGFYRSGGRMLSARVGRARFSDLVWMLGGVGMRFCAPLVGMEKGELDAASRDYLQTDLAITRAVMARLDHELEYYAVSKPGATLASAALKIFKSIGGEIAAFPPELEHVARAAYYGGRTEAFHYGERVVDGFDVNSMFPFAMIGDAFPSGAYRRTKDLDGADVVRARVHVPPCFCPPLPLRRERLIFPVGRFTGTWTGEELRHAVGVGVTVERLIFAFKAESRARPFDAFSSTLFARRAHDSFSNYHAKRTLNSLYGKMAQTGTLEHVTGFLDAQTVKELDLPARDYNPLWSAIITARARVHLHKLLVEAGDALHYCDTDSIFVESSRASTFKARVGGDLGALKHEYERASMLALAPKLYRIRCEGEDVYKSRGVPDHAAREFFETGSASYDKPLRLREAVRRKLTPNVWAAIEKSFGVGGFDKRKRLPGGATAPLEIWD